MDDLFDMVKAAPPPERVRPLPTKPKRFRNTSPTCSLPLPSPRSSPPLSDNDTTSNDKDKSPATLKRAIIRIKRFSLQEHTREMEAQKANMTAKSTIVAALQSSAEKIRSCLTKTKAQQKQFDDELPLSNSTDNNTISISKSKADKQNTTNAADRNSAIPGSAKTQETQQCQVRLRRLDAKDIEAYLSGGQRGNRGRASKAEALGKHSQEKPKSLNGRKRKLINSTDVSSRERRSPLAKQKIKTPNGSPPLHFKITPKGTRHSKRRRSTPSPGATPAATPLARRLPRRSSELETQFGSRVFRCYVRMPRCKHPVAQEFEQSNERRRKSRRLNLSVSFKESVEIIGQSELDVIMEEAPDMSPNSVPTRLTRTQNGKVVEDVALDGALFTMPSPVINIKRLKKKRSFSISCESGERDSQRRARKAARRSGETIPLSGMARLRIDDSHAEKDEGTDEYIVPNELPQRRSTTDRCDLKSFQIEPLCMLSLPPPTPTVAETKECAPTLTDDQLQTADADKEGPELHNVNKSLEASPVISKVIKTEPVDETADDGATADEETADEATADEVTAHEVAANESTASEPKAAKQLNVENKYENVSVKIEPTSPLESKPRRLSTASNIFSFQSAVEGGEQAHGTSPHLVANNKDVAAQLKIKTEDNADETETNVNKDTDAEADTDTDNMPAQASTDKAATWSPSSSFIAGDDASNVAIVNVHNISPTAVAAELDKEKDELGASSDTTATIVASCSQESNSTSQPLGPASAAEETDAAKDCVAEADESSSCPVASAQSPTAEPLHASPEETSKPSPAAENATPASCGDASNLSAVDEGLKLVDGGENGN